MALEKTFINVGLTAGVNRKRDAHQLQNGELFTGDNIVFSAVDGQITKRYGYERITPNGAPYPNGPFTGIGVRDNMEPVVLGTNYLNRYNIAQNTNAALKVPISGRLRVSQIGASSGTSSTPASPLGVSVASDGVKYAMVAWREETVLSGGGGQYTQHNIFYGLQDLVTGTWIQPPQPFTVNNNLTGAGDGGTYAYTPYATYHPQVRYANGLFYLYVYCCFYANVTGALGFSGSSTKYHYEIRAYSISPSNWTAFLTETNFRHVAANSINYLAPPAYCSYDVAMDTNAQTNTISVTTDPSQANAAHQVFFWTMTALGSLDFARTASSIPSYGSCQGQRMVVKAASNGSGLYAFYNGQTYAVYNFNATFKFTGAFGSYFPCKPVDVSFAPDGRVVVLGYSAQQYSTKGLALILTPNATTYTTGISNFVQAPASSFYLEYVSRIFYAPDGTPCVWLMAGGPNSDTTNNAAYLVSLKTFFNSDAGDLNSRVLARTQYLSCPHIGGGYYNQPCSVLQLPGTQKYVTFLTSLTEITNQTYASYGVMNRTQFDFTPQRPAQILPLPTGGNIIAGACPMYYDGNSVSEMGFSSAPDYTAALSTTDFKTVPPQPVAIEFKQTSIDGTMLSGGASLTTASGYIEYYYVVCFVRRDAYGNVTRSAPSPVLTVPCQYANQYVHFNPLTYQSGGPTNDVANGVIVEYYRTTQNAAGTYYFLASVPLGTAFNDYTPDVTPIAFNFSNARSPTITSNRTVYTNSGELPVDPPPACHHMTIGESRAFMIPSDQRNIVWYSKQFSPGRGVEWCANLTISEGLNSGQFTAIQILDSNVIVFKEDSICYFYGTGPDNTGGSGGFSQFQKLATDVGCIDPGSIALIPEGIVFRSRRGIELLTRGLGLQYIGDPVEPIVQALPEIVSVVCMPNFTELRFVTNDPLSPVLCFDYQAKRWSTFSGMSSKAAANMFGEYWFISADGTVVNRETKGKYLDNGQPITMTLETAEIPVGAAGIQGWGRVYRMALLGDFYSNHQITASFAYDHSSSYSDQVVFDTTKGLISGDAVYQYRLSRVPRQTMQSVRIRLQDSNITSGGQSCAITNLVLETASKNGLGHLPSAKTV